MAQPFNGFALRGYLAQQVRPPVQDQVQQYGTITDPTAANTGTQHQLQVAKGAVTRAGRQSALRNFLLTQ